MIQTNKTYEKIDWCKKRPKNCSEYMYSTGYYNEGKFSDDECRIFNYLVNDSNGQIEGEFISMVKLR